MNGQAPVPPIMKYPGAKWQLFRWIVSHLPPGYTHYIEPYCGSAAIFFSKEPSRHEVLGDTNSSITNLFTVLRTRGEELATQIALTPWCEADYEAIEGHYDDAGDELEDARRFLMRSWQAHGGTIAQVSGWKHNGLNGKAYPAHLWKKLPERLLLAADRLKDAEVRNRPALELIRYYNASDVLLYVDPPYLLSTRARKYYRHEMTDGEHEELLEALLSHRGAVVLSGYTNALYNRRLSHWYRTETPAVTEHGNVRMEVLWLNPRAAGRQQLSLFDREVS